MTNLLFVVNPISGDKDKEEILSAAKDYFSKQYILDFFETTGKDDYLQLIKKIEHLKDGIVVAVGGDGTINLVARVVMERNLKMAIVPCGSANGMARELEIPLEFMEAFAVIDKGSVREIDIICINKEMYSLHLSDLGFNAKIIRKFEQSQKRGLLSYAKLFIRELFSLQEHRYVIHFEKRKIKVKVLMVLIANSTRYGSGAVVNPTGLLNDGAVELILFRPHKFWHFWRMLFHVITGSQNELEFIETYSGKEFLIENQNRQNLQVDGEYMGKPEKVHVKVIPGAVKILT